MKRLTMQQVSSVTLALLSLAEWAWLGFATPALRAVHQDFQVDPGDLDWPYPYVMTFHWAWCVPVGIVLFHSHHCKGPVVFTPRRCDCQSRIDCCGHCPGNLVEMGYNASLDDSKSTKRMAEPSHRVDGAHACTQNGGRHRLAWCVAFC